MTNYLDNGGLLTEEDFATVEQDPINEFLSGLVISDKRIKEIAQEFSLKVYQVESAVVDCAENIDDQTAKDLFEEYNGDCKKLASWFESYVVDSVQQLLEDGHFE